MSDTLTEFYTGKTLFITGAAGFLGTFLLEILLRCFPGILRIYILLRPKDDIQPKDRKEMIFTKKILLQISKNNPDLMEKVHVIPGDISMPDLGMNEEDLTKICREVSIVFHGAAIVNFSKPYRDISLQNAMGTDNVIILCRKLKKLDVFVYTSSAYSNCHVLPERIREKVYLLPIKAQTFLEEIKNGTTESFNELVSSLSVKWPNSYTFSKCLAENILLEKASDLPVAIIRPSIVIMPWKGTCPGDLEPGTGIADLSVGVGKGFVRVIHGDKDCIFDVIPVDLVANTHIIGAWSVATGRRPSMFVVHCTSGDVLKLKFESYIKDMYEVSQRFPLPNLFQTTSIRLVKNKLIYRMLTLYEHYIPAAMLDIYLSFKGSKLRLVKLYKFFDGMMEHLHYFTSTSFDFQNANFHSLSQYLQPDERQLIYTDITAGFAEIVSTMPTGSDIFNWKFDKLPKEKRLHLVSLRSMVITFIRRFTLLLFILLIYFIISKLMF